MPRTKKKYLNINNQHKVEIKKTNMSELLELISDTISDNSEHLYLECNTIETKFHRFEMTDEEIVKASEKFIKSL